MRLSDIKDNIANFCTNSRPSFCADNKLCGPQPHLIPSRLGLHEAANVHVKLCGFGLEGFRMCCLSAAVSDASDNAETAPSRQFMFMLQFALLQLSFLGHKMFS